MIRKFRESDMAQVLKIWLDASIEAHDFVEHGFWESKVDDMENIYLPAGENYVYEENGKIKGFFSLVDETLAAIFVDPASQGCGIGKTLIAKAKKLRSSLKLSVYKKNIKSVNFYINHGFVIVKEQIDKHTGEAEILMSWIN